jgi:hypothetical protein
MSQPLHREDPPPDDRPAGRAQHPSLASLSDFDAALALAGIRRDSPGDEPRMASVSIPGHRFGSPRGRGWRTRRRQAWLMGAHGTATLLSAHRSTNPPGHGQPGHGRPAPGGAPAA